MSYQYVPVTLALLFLIIVASFLFLGSNLSNKTVSHLTGMATSGSCPASIETTMDSDHYYVGEIGSFTTRIWDGNGNFMLNQPFYRERYANNEYLNTVYHTTSADGVCRVSGYVSDALIGNVKFVTYVDVAGCDRVSDIDYFTVEAAGATTTTTTLPSGSSSPDNDWIISDDDMYAGVSGYVGIGTLKPGYKLDVNGKINANEICIAGICKSSWSGSGSSTTTTTTTSTLSDFAEGQLYGYIGLQFYMVPGVGCEPNKCTAKYPGYCYNYDIFGSSGIWTGYEPKCVSGWTLVLLFEDDGDGICIPAQRLYSCYRDYKSPFCGNGRVESGEACDDGNTVNDAGNCYSDCSKSNFFYLTPVRQECSYSGQKLYESFYPDSTTADKICQQYGFNKQSRYSRYYNNNYCPTTEIAAKWNGVSWICEHECNSIYALWCE